MAERPYKLDIVASSTDAPPPEVFEAIEALIARGLIFVDDAGALRLTETGEAAADGRCDVLPIRLTCGHGADRADG